MSKLITPIVTIEGSDDPVSILLANMVKYDIDGNVLSFPTESEKWDMIRKTRNKMLDDTDWIIVDAMEAGLSVDVGVIEYRVALREITDNFGRPDDVVFPDMPE